MSMARAALAWLLALAACIAAAPPLPHHHPNDINGAHWTRPGSANARDFYSDRESLLAAEAALFLGADLQLSAQEETVNAVLMTFKEAELSVAFEASTYPPADSFFVTRPAIEASSVFGMIKAMPKGAALHLHEIAITSIDYVIQNITYRPNLFICADGISANFRWLESASDDATCTAAEWVRVSDMREAIGQQNMDDFLRSIFVINVPNPHEVYPDINTVWSAFSSALGAVGAVISHEPVFRDYIERALLEFMQDGVQYLEIRSVLPNDICRNVGADCDPLSALEVATLMRDVAEEFTAAHPGDFCGAGLIYAPSRRVTPEVVEGYVDTAAELMIALPDFVRGFDLVSQEDLGNPLIDFSEQLLEAQSQGIPFFFHSGETNWQGQETDLNLVDAVLLNSTRLGHAYAIVKHPRGQADRQERNIPMEVCPISNQVLGLVEDLRNHPAATLIQEGHPIVISSDDPAAWEALPISHDYYQAFMGLAAKHMDLRLLKKLVFSSVEYSAMAAAQKQQCTQLVEDKWQQYIQGVINNASKP